MQWLAKLKIGSKLTLLIAPPIILLLFAAGRDGWRELQTARKAERFTSSVDLIDRVERSSHELQIERRLSVSFIRSKQRQLSQALITQRKKTDREIEAFFQHMKNSDLYTSNVQREITNNYQIVRQLSSLRGRVDLTAVEAETVEFLFDRLLKNPAAIVRAAKYDAPTAELTSQIEAYLFLINAIDIAHLERDNLSVFVDRSLDVENISAVRIKLLTDLATQEELALRGFSANIRSDIEKRYKSFLLGSANEKIQNFRNYTTFSDRLLQNPSQAKNWLPAADRRIEELRVLAKEQDRSIRALASRSSAAALRHFWSSPIFSAATLCLCSLFITILRRAITQPLMEVTQAAQSLSQGEIPENLTYRGTDEIGEVADSFRSLQNTLQMLSREIEEPNRALQRGDRRVRGNDSLFKGIWRYLIQEMNLALDIFAQLGDRLSQKADRQATVSYLGALALETFSTEDLGDRIVEEVARGLNCDLCEIFLVGIIEEELICRSSTEIDRKGSKLDRQIIQFEEERGIIAPLNSNYRSAAAIPIPGKKGMLGFIIVQDSQPQFFETEDLSWLQSIAQIFANAVQRHNGEKNSQYQTLYDRLTGLPNRLFLEKELQKCLNLNDGQTALIFFDLDRFNLINNSYGHAIGDKTLITVARKIISQLQPQDILIRFGIDEFVVLCKQIPDRDYPQNLAHQIAQLFNDPCQIENLNLYLSASIGIAYSSDSCKEPNRLLQEADMAMYQAKQQLGIAISTFDSRLYTKVLRRLELEYLLRKAREKGELFLQYQPIVSLQNSEGAIAKSNLGACAASPIVSYEALLRWQHPQYGFISPVEFIPVAEETGQILAIGDFVLHEAMQEFHSLSQKIPDWEAYVAVNVSVHQLFARDLPQKIGKLLEEIGLNPKFLCLEVTESAIIQNVEEAVQTLKQIQAMGIRLALDDFGTGYSSFSYLTRMPLDIVKIDRSFVANLSKADADVKIISAIVNMAHELGLKVIAEGVETQQEADLLTSIGCDRAQGYLFGRPQSIDR
jgi:diguanylate cyclase (GGDEF)-like protein